MTPEQISEFNKFGNLQRPGKTPEQIRVEAEARAKGAGTGKFKPAPPKTPSDDDKAYNSKLFGIFSSYARRRASIKQQFEQNLSKNIYYSTEQDQSKKEQIATGFKSGMGPLMSEIDALEQQEIAKLNSIYGIKDSTPQTEESKNIKILMDERGLSLGEARKTYNQWKRDVK